LGSIGTFFGVGGIFNGGMFLGNIFSLGEKFLGMTFLWEIPNWGNFVGIPI